jgi:hypothetical protein
VGHFLDYQLIGNTVGYASQSDDDMLSCWRLAVRSTGVYRRLSVLAKRSPVRVVEPSGSHRFMPVDRIYVRYLLRPQELFARSYAQFVAAESQHPLLLRYLNRVRVSREDFLSYPEHWDDADFMGIQGAFRRVILDLKWQK